MSAVTSRARKISHNHGIELPSMFEQAYDINKKNGNTFWIDTT